jgi:hypothetical protein
MNHQIKSVWQTIAFIATVFLFLIASFPAVAQGNWSSLDSWRAQYKVGDKVQMTISGSESDFQTCTVTENDPSAVMRVRCDAFKHWVAGDYIASKGSVRPLTKAKTPPNDRKNKDETEETPAAETQNNSAKWGANDKWRSGYEIGDKIRVTFSEKPEDFQNCVVTENEPESVLRVKCGDFKHWKAGVYIVHSEANLTAGNTNSNAVNNPKNAPPKQTSGNSSGLKIGEYACTGSGGRMMIGLGFKVLSGNRYTNLDGDQSGTFTISGGKITFRGGHLDGVIGRDLKDNWFTVASQAQCGPYN